MNKKNIIIKIIRVISAISSFLGLMFLFSSFGPEISTIEYGFRDNEIYVSYAILFAFVATASWVYVLQSAMKDYKNKLILKNKLVFFISLLVFDIVTLASALIRFSLLY